MERGKIRSKKRTDKQKFHALEHRQKETFFIFQNTIDKTIKLWYNINVIDLAASKANRNYNNTYFRGVAKVVSRQFRVLEIVGSSPVASTIFSGFDRRKTAR